jgi:monovalent cation:H+ antiporter-2, CPA2 family
LVEVGETVGMDHSAALIETMAIGLVAAFIGGIVASKLRMPTIVGYLVAGMAVGPFTPGLVADTHTAQQLAELGVILLMFGVGIHFSIADLLAVRGIAIPGAVGQIAIATVLGVGLGILLGWGAAGGLVLGLAVSVASTIVLLRALEARDEVGTPQGRIAVGWLIVEDLFTVLVLVLLPTLAPMLLGEGGQATDVLLGLGIALLKLVTFAALMLVVGSRLVPRLLMWVKATRSREVFTLAVLAIAIGIAVAAYAVFGVSFALGAFLAGVVLNESEISHEAAEEALPLRDAFAVLFFVSVGMLFDPAYVLAHPGAIALVTLLVVVAKSLAAFLLVVLLRRPLRVALTVGAALSQVGEFSFILATLGLTLGLIPEDGFQLVVAAALVSITLNPFLFRLIEPAERFIRARPGLLRVLDGPAGQVGQAGDPGQALR